MLATLSGLMESLSLLLIRIKFLKGTSQRISSRLYAILFNIPIYFIRESGVKNFVSDPLPLFIVSDPYEQSCIIMLELYLF